MKPTGKDSLRNSLFRVGVLFKGLDALLEISGGLAALLINPVVIVRIVAVLTQDETAEHSRDFVVNFLRHEARRILFIDRHFLTFYLLGHGVAKLFVVVALIRNKLWAYPVAMVVFGAFIVYQTYRGAVSGHMGIFIFTLLDLIVVILIWLEYRALKSGHASHLQ